MKPGRSVDPLEGGGVVGVGLAVELDVEIGEEEVGLGLDAGAGGEVDEVLGLGDLAQALLAGPGTDADALRGDEAEGGEALECGIDPAVHGDVGGAELVDVQLGVAGGIGGVVGLWRGGRRCGEGGGGGREAGEAQIGIGEAVGEVGG